MLASSINPNNWVESINEAVVQEGGEEVAEAEVDHQKEVVAYSIPLKNQQYPTLQNHSNQSLQVVSTLINYLNH